MIDQWADNVQYYSAETYIPTASVTGLAITREGDYLLCLARALEREAGAYGVVRLPFTIWEFTAGVCYRRSAAELPFVSLLVHELRRLTAHAC